MGFGFKHNDGNVEAASPQESDASVTAAASESQLQSQQQPQFAPSVASTMSEEQ